MSDNQRQHFQSQLEQVIRSASMTDRQREDAERLLSGITKPIRLTILGLHGSGKSTLADLFLGKTVLGEGDRLPTVQIKAGERVQTTCTMPDGSKRVFDHCNSRDIAAQNAIHLEMEMPLPALNRISLLEVVASDNPAEQKRAIRWAAKRTDIAVWCTQEFAAAERAIWHEMPDNLKGHAYLLITKADILADRGTLGETLAQLGSISEGQFKQVLSIQTKAAIEAKAADGTIDKQKMTRSGGRALISAIMRDVEQGKQAVYDRVDILLQRHQQAAGTDTQAEETSADAPQIPATLPPIAQQHPPPMSLAPVDVEQLQPMSLFACLNAVAALSSTGQTMVRDLKENDTLAQGQVMKKSLESVLWLDDYLRESGDAADPQLQRILQTTADARHLIRSLEFEETGQASMDALSLVVQLKREIESTICAHL